MKSRRNSMAGSHPSYDKRGMSEESRRKKIAYDTKYHKSEKRKKYRAELNQANREKKTYGNGDGKDVSHTKSGKLVLENQKNNRSRNGSGKRSRLK